MNAGDIWALGVLERRFARQSRDLADQAADMEEQLDRALALQQYLYDELLKLDPEHPALVKGSPIFDRVLDQIPDLSQSRKWGTKVSEETPPSPLVARLARLEAENAQMKQALAQRDDAVQRLEKILQVQMEDNAFNLAWRMILRFALEEGAPAQPLLGDTDLRDRVQRTSAQILRSAYVARSTGSLPADVNLYDPVREYAQNLWRSELREFAKRHGQPGGDSAARLPAEARIGN